MRSGIKSLNIRSIYHRADTAIQRVVDLMAAA